MNEGWSAFSKSVALVVLAFAAMIYTYQYARSVDRLSPTRTFTVEGTADIDTTPDVAMFSATVTTEGSQDIASIQKTNTEKMNKINKFLKDQGVKEKDLKTLQYNLYPRYSSPTCDGGYCPPASIVGYTLTQTLEVKVREMNQASALLSGAVTNGANTVSDLRFVLDDDTAAKNKAREEAINKAKNQAGATAKAAGFRLGSLVSIYESSDSSAPIPYALDRASEAKAAMMAPTIEPGVQTTTVNVTLTYEIE